MTLQDRLASMDPRERRLLVAFFGVLAGLVVLMMPLGVSALLGEKQERNQALKDAIERIEREGDAIRERQAKQEAIVARYAEPAPALAGFLDKAASASGLDIPEVKDQSPVAHGKRYEERSTSISFRKTGLLALVKFMERVSGGEEPIGISKLSVRKRGVEPDTYDVQMTVSAFHRLAPRGKATQEEE